MITIESVDVVAGFEDLAGCYIDAPVAGSSVDGHVLRITGWALGIESPVRWVEVGSLDHGVIARVELDRPRPDIEAAFGPSAISSVCGFDLAISLLGVPAAFTFWVVATDGRGGRWHIASVRGRRTTVELPVGAGPVPVMVTTLGRTGSTWLTQLLGAHPDVLALEPFRLEPRVVSYWAEVCRTLSSPSSYRSPLVSTEPETDDWWLGRGRVTGELGGNPRLEGWLATSHITDVATFCRDRIEAFYRSAADEPGADGPPRYVVEKLNPTWVPDLVWELFPASKEIFLVRDFRDRLASVFDFNRKRGYEAFGRADHGSDEEYVREKVRVDAETLLEAWGARRDRSLLVRYEDLVLKPRETAATILEHLGFAHDGESVTSITASARLSDDETASHRTTPDVAASVGRWRHDLDERLQRVCEEELGELLLEFGYDVREPVS